MKLLRRHSGKPVHVDFVLYVETLSPWPSKYGTIAVQWHRGKRSGQTKPATPSSQRASAISNYSFREIIILPATIYRSGEGFEPKECGLFIVHVDEKGKEIEILGAVEFSLTDYIKQSISRQIFHIECAPSIWAPGSGRPTLTLGIGISRQGEELDRVVEELKAYCALDEADIPSRLSTDDEASRPSSRAASRTHFGDVLDGDSPGQAASMNDVSTLGSTFSKATKRPTLATTQVLSSHDSKYIGAEYDEDGILVESQEYNVPTKSMAGEQKVDEVKQGRSIAMDDNTETIEKFYKEHEQNRPLPESKKHEEDSDNRIDRSGRSDQDEGLQGGYGVKRNLERQLSEISGGLQRPYSVTNTENSIGIIRRFSSFGDGNGALGSKSWTWKRQIAEMDDSSNGAEATKVTKEIKEYVEAVRAPSTLSTFSAESKERAVSTLSADVSLGAADSGVDQALETLEDQSKNNGLLGKYVEELQMTAALESSVYLAGLGWMGSSEDNPPLVTSLQAPARRIARTVIILGPEKGIHFGHQAISAIQSAASAALDDPHRLTVWWVNTVLLRWSFWALSKSDTKKPVLLPTQQTKNNNFDWLTLTLSPSLLDLESRLFADLVEHLWQCVVYLEALKSASAHASAHGRPLGADQKDKGVDVSRANGKVVKDMMNIDKNSPRDLEELVNIDKVGSAAMHWIAGLQGAYQAINQGGRPPAGPRPLVNALWKQILWVLLRRMDEQLLKGIVESEEEKEKEEEETDGIHHTPVLRESETLLFPFSHGPLTFLQGAEMKVIAGRLSSWATDVGIRDAGKLFPMLRAAANLLMLPKGGLLDGDVRGQVVGVLPSAAIARILQRYVSTNGPIGDDSFSPGLLRQLKAEAASSNTQLDEWWKYEPTSNESLLQQGVVQPISLDMNPDSDDELAGLEERAAGKGRTVARYQLLRQLWKTAGRGVVGEEM